jgi:hypothetical protein
VSGQESLFREPGRVAQYLCIACYRQLLGEPGDCGVCGAPLLCLDDPAVLDELREHARDVWQRKSRNAFRKLSATVYLAQVAICAAAALAWHARPDLWFGVVVGPMIPTLAAVSIGLGFAARRAERRERRRMVPRHFWQWFIPERCSAAELLEVVGLLPAGTVPERAPAATTLHACLACFGAASDGPGTCSKCGAPLRALGDPEAIEGLRRKVRAVWWANDSREYTASHSGNRSDPLPLQRGFLADDLDAAALLAELGLRA